MDNYDELIARLSLIVLIILLAASFLHNAAFL
jgi:hypothetical protein